MGQRLERARTHFRENKDRYATGGVCLVVGAAAAYLYKPNVKVITDSYNLKFKSPTINEVTTILARRGHPGNLLRCNETGEVFASQGRAADLMGLSRGRLSQHVNGKLDDVGGYTFEKIGEAQ